jgi:hypothetical protein
VTAQEEVGLYLLQESFLKECFEKNAQFKQRFYHYLACNIASRLNLSATALAQLPKQLQQQQLTHHSVLQRDFNLDDTELIKKRKFCLCVFLQIGLIGWELIQI